MCLVSSLNCSACWGQHQPGQVVYKDVFKDSKQEQACTCVVIIVTTRQAEMFALPQDSILVAGYPLGGDSLSITKGIVSRVTMTRYAHASNKLLGIQIDAAINPGNSGGPAFADLKQARSCLGPRDFLF